MRRTWMGIAALLLFGIGALASTGCSSATMFESRPAGAEVVVDGEYEIGETPVEVRELPWIGANRHYQFDLDGYHSEVVEISASMHQRHLLACFCSLGLLWPLMLFGEFPSAVQATMEPRREASRAEFSPQPRIDYGPR